MSKSEHAPIQAPTTADENVLSGFERMVEKYPNKLALIYLGKSFSYSKLMLLINKFTNALYALGVAEHDKVMIYISNCPQFLIAYFAAQKMGAVPVPISPIYTVGEIEYLINNSEAETIVCEDINYGYVREVYSKTCLKRIIVTNLADLLPRWKYWVGRLFDRIPVGVVRRSKEVFFFKRLLRQSSVDEPKVTIHPKNHMPYLLFTSGTTGFPKGVPGSHADMATVIRDYHEVAKGHIKEGGVDVLIMVSPLFHMLGQTTILGWGLSLGIKIVLMPKPKVDSILKAIERYKGTLFLGVPALYRMILENERLEQYNLSSLRFCWSGGDVLPASIYDRWLEKFGVSIYPCYGSTEVIAGTLNLLDRKPVPGSIGFPTTSREVKVVDPESLEELPLNTMGELLITSEDMIKSYWKSPEETAISYVEKDGKTWYRTKDYVQMDESGLVYYIERSADIVKYKGYKISCSEIESVLMNHPAVIKACVVGVRDERVGERIKAIVVLKSDVRGISGSDLTLWCRERLIPYKVPKYIEFRDMLPMSKVGKLLRREIRDEEAKRTET